MRPIALDATRDTPLYSQLVEAIRDQIARGELRPGDGLPTVRELARQLQLNQNTVNRAYGVLHAAGLLAARSRQGTRVARQVHAEHLQSTRESELHALTSHLIGVEI